MNKKVKNGSSSSTVSKKAASTKKMTKKDLEIVIKSLEDKQLRLKAEFDNFRKRKESEISALFKYDGKNFITDFLSIFR
jgi:molecular chaperone GrpE